MITMIFGAGASVPFFNPILNTQYLTDKVSNIDEWTRIISKYKDKKGDGYSIVDPDEVIGIIDIIKSNKPNANFEEIAEVIDKISSYGYNCFPDSNMLNNLIHTMLQIRKIKYGNPFGARWKDVPFLLREIIAEAILDLQNNHKGASYQTFSDSQKNLIQALCAESEDVSVVSLNYDDCLFDSLSGLGFDHGFYNLKKNYLLQIDIKRFMNAKRVIYFPHGHLRFLYVDNKQVTYWHDSNQANDERWKSIDGQAVGSTLTVLSGKFAYNYNTFLATGQTKDDGLNTIPYSIYYQRLAIDLSKSDTIFVIGYSFGDLHINRMLMSYLEADSLHKIVVVDYYQDVLTMTNEYKEADNIILRIHLCFGTEWGVLLDNGVNLKPMNPEGVNSVNQKGYGWIFDQVLFYKKGYAAFLDEYENVSLQMRHLS